MINRKKIASEFASSIKKQASGITKIVLFGSVASGKDRKNSDIDLLVVSKGNSRAIKKKVMAQVVRTLLEKSVYVSVKVISDKEYVNLKNTYFISKINRRGIVLG